MNRRERRFFDKLKSEIDDWQESEKGKVSQWSGYVNFAPELFRFICRLSESTAIAADGRQKLAVAIEYFMRPVDFIPEAALGPAGYMDDIAIAVYTLKILISEYGPETVEKFWKGEDEIHGVIRGVLNVADEKFGRGLWRTLRALVDDPRMFKEMVNMEIAR
ncbi:YkvA family protein [Thermodesulfobacteriota bacterium]